MKITYHHRTRGDGAEGVHIQEMVTAFDALGHDVNMCCPMGSVRKPGLSFGMTGVSSSSRKVLKNWFHLRIRQLIEISYNAVSFTRLCLHLLKHRPDFIYERYSSYHFAGVLASRILGIPLVLEVNATDSGRFSHAVLAFPRIAKLSEDFCLQKASGIAVVSTALRECVFDRGVEAGRVIVTPNAINYESISDRLEDGSRERVRHDMGISDRLVIGFVGSMRKWHGVDMLVESIPEILYRLPDSVFLIVGSGELEKDVLAVQENPELGSRMYCTGGVDHDYAIQLISAMDVGLMPHSNLWGSPMKILEYMSFGLVTIAPDISPIRDVLEPDVTGLLFETGNAKEFVDKIIHASSDPELRSRIGNAAKDYIVQSRQWKHNADMVIELMGNSTSE